MLNNLLNWLKRLRQIKFNVRLVLSSILVFSFVTRIYRLNQPADYYFDEIYHVPAAKLIVAGDIRAFEWWHPPTEGTANFDWLHPPLAKYFQALSMLILGQNALGWRLSSVVFGLLVVWTTYLVAKQLFNQEHLALLASFLVSLDGLILVQSRIAMNDIQVTFWILMAIWGYLRSRQLFNQRQLKQSNLWLLITGSMIGLALATKWSAVFVLLLLLSIEFWQLFSHWLDSLKSIRKKFISWKKLPWIFFTLIIIPALIYLASYLPMFTQGKNLDDFFELQQQIVNYQFYRDDQHLYASRPWQWWLNLRPVWYWHQDLGTKTANIYALGNPVLFITGAAAVIITLVYLIRQHYSRTILLTKKKQNYCLGMLLLVYLSTWLPWIFSPRIMFFYHYTPAVPLMMILLSYWLSRLWQLSLGRQALLVILLLISFSFLIFYPHWTGLAVTKRFADKVYFGLSSWR